MKYIISVLALAFTLIACNTHYANGVAFSADDQFTEDERLYIHDYVMILSALTDSKIDITYDFQHRDIVASDSFVIERTDGTGGVFSLSPGYRCIRVGTFTNDFSASYTSQMVARILIHEIAHSLGMKHTTDPNSLMYPFVNQEYFVWTDADQAECKRVGVCK
jgi:hypothetical protein